jgi:hypothetical protein
MNTQAVRSPQLPWYRHRWPWLLMLGPGLVVVAGIYTMWLAVRSQDALVVDDYYKQGKAINQDLRRARNATALGMQMQLAYDPARGMLSGRVQGDAAARTGALRLRLVHSTQAAKDLSLLVQPDAHGEFTVSLPMLEMARWQVLAEDNGNQWRLQGAWQWPQDRTLSLSSEAPAKP